MALLYRTLHPTYTSSRTKQDMYVAFLYTAYHMHATDSAADLRFRPSERLRHKREFDAVFRHKCSTLGNGLIVYIRANELDYARLGIVVGRGYGNAVARNAIKRRLREAFRHHKAEARGYDVVVLPRDKERLTTMRAVEAGYLAQLERCIARSGSTHGSAREGVQP